MSTKHVNRFETPFLLENIMCCNVITTMALQWRSVSDMEAKRGRLDHEGFLRGLTLFLHSAALSPFRRTLFERQIRSHGGTLVNDLHAGLDAVVLVESNLIDPSRLSRVIDKCAEGSQGSQLTFLPFRWLSECLRVGQRVDMDEYRLEPGSSPVPSTSKRVDQDPSSKGTATGPTRTLFVCAHSSEDPSKPLHHNKVITDELGKLAAAYKHSNDTWRAFGYEKAIAAIKRHPEPITSKREASAIKGVGMKMAEKIEEILNSGKLRKVQEVCEGEKAKTLALFNRVWGAGPSTAETWYCQGFRSLDDLKEKATLTSHQKVGLRLFDELDERMGRSEAAEIEETVRHHAQKLAKGLEIIGCGSYRRGKPNCGDLDVLITHEEDRVLEGLFEKLIKSMHKSGFLTDDLTVQLNANQKKYLGVCKLPHPDSKHRRLDIIVVPYRERATALLYFTGSAHFNRSMRLLAIKMGMSLSEHSLRKNVQRHHKEKVNDGCILPTPTEKSIFVHLGLDYREPNERDH